MFKGKSVCVYLWFCARMRLYPHNINPSFCMSLAQSVWGSVREDCGWLCRSMYIKKTQPAQCWLCPTMLYVNLAGDMSVRLNLPCIFCLCPRAVCSVYMYHQINQWILGHVIAMTMAVNKKKQIITYFVNLNRFWKSVIFTLKRGFLNEEIQVAAIFLRWIFVASRLTWKRLILT